MKAYRDRVRQQAAEHGRNPDDIKVLFLAHPIVDVIDGGGARAPDDGGRPRPNSISTCICPACRG